jgi:hypothetical protein
MEVSLAAIFAVGMGGEVEDTRRRKSRQGRSARRKIAGNQLKLQNFSEARVGTFTKNWAKKFKPITLGVQRDRTGPV